MGADNEKSTNDLLAEEGVAKSGGSLKRVIFASLVAGVVGAAVAAGVTYALKSCPAPGTSSEAVAAASTSHEASASGGTQYGVFRFQQIVLADVLAPIAMNHDLAMPQPATELRACRRLRMPPLRVEMELCAHA